MNATSNSPALRAREQSDRAELTAIVVTSSPDVFVESLAQEFGLQVLVCATKDQALSVLHTHHCKNAFVDLAEIKSEALTSWTGFRFLRHVREAEELSGVAVWLMTADKVYPHTEWASALGAAGFVTRNAAAVSRAIRAALSCPLTAIHGPNQTSMRQIERALLRLAPGKSKDLFTAARQVIAASRGGTTAHDYATALVASLTPDDLRDALLRSAGVDPSQPLTS